MIQFNNLVIEIENRKSLCFFLLQEWVFSQVLPDSMSGDPEIFHPEMMSERKHG